MQKIANKEWLIKQLNFEKECGQNHEIYNFSNTVFYLVSSAGGKALINEESPNKEDYEPFQLI